MDLDALPWAELDGPSLVGCAAALQLLPENISCLTRAQRLAAIGAALPARPAARPLSPSRLRAVLKDPLISGEYVRSQEDPYEDIYVEEVAFHGGPKLVLQGLTNHSAHTARVLLNAIFHSPDHELPEEYVRQARLLTSAVLSLSHAVCSRAGLRRGITAAQARRGEPFVPGAARLAELRSAVTFTPGDLSNLLTNNEMQTLREWITEAGAHRVSLDGSVTDNGLVLRPLVRHGTSLIIANPGELAAALRHQLIVMADIHGCRDALAGAFRRTVAELTRELLSQVDAIPRGPAAPTTDPLVLRQVFDAASGTIIDVGVLTDDLSGYDPADPFGHWDIPNVGQPLQDCLDPPGPPGRDDERTLRLALYDDLARTQTVALERYRRPGPLLAVPLDELQVMIDLDADDPLFLWRFARANERLHESSRVLSWSVLDTYSIYRDHDHSFYLDDDRPPNVVSVSVASGASLRADAQRRHDRHYVPDPDGRKYVEVASVYGSDTAPIYYRHPRHGPAALLVEFAGATAWVLRDTETSEAVSGFLFTLLEAVAYWIWQLGLEQPIMLAGAAGPGGRLRVVVEPDDSSRWFQVLTGQSPDDPDGPEDGRGSASVSWVTASADSQGAITVTVLAEHARVLLSGTNLADQQLVAALARALAPGDPPGQIDAVAARIAPPGPKRMIHVWRSGDVMLVPAGASMRAVQPAVTATILDDLGQWLVGQGLDTGPLPSDERTKILGQVVEYCYQRIARVIAGLSPDGLIPFLVAQDEAVIQDNATRAQRLQSQLACFGPDSVRAHKLLDDERQSVRAAVASRFLVEYVAATPEAMLMWGARRALYAARYWEELIFAGRVRGATRTMKTLMGTIRQDQNKAFERKVETVLRQSGIPVTGSGIKRICGQRLLSASGADLGDIDAIALEPSSKTIIVAEAKDFELARNPAELANEAEDLLIGDKSAVYKLGRRADWIRGHVALVLRHFGVSDNPAGWRVLPVIVTSMNLLTPRVLQASIPVVALPELPSWFRQQSNRRQRRHQRK